MIEKTLGHYRIGEQLGRGGMGEVYLADDLNLNRKVALKFLPDLFTGDPERMARFEREAKLLASLNHPNIAAIYGLEEADGKRFLVLELVEGETLAQRLSKGPLPVEEALGICRQIAEALEAAHEKGVIHRDLKPANVMITEGDKVKILDFGLAKALADETQSVDSSQSPTLTEAMTRPGVILGTAAYMSPEQAKGKAVDKRADIWAFGCILYECLTGKRAFEGETVTEILAAILRGEPDWKLLPTAIPPKIRFVLRHCLEKELSRRFHHTADLRILMEEPLDSSVAPERTKRPWLPWVLTAIATLLLIALAVYSFFSFREREASEAMRFQISVPAMPDDYSMAISPDGRFIAYVASTSATVAPSLFVCEIGSIKPRQLNDTEGATYPFWSPDSRSIAFVTGRRLRRINASGGSPRDICAVTSMWGGTWNQEDVILFSDWPVWRRVSAEGGEPSTITTPAEYLKELRYYPYFLPDGHHYLYEARFSLPSKNGVYVGSLDSQEKAQLLKGESSAVYVYPGYILYQREGTLFARPFDAETRTFSGEEVQIADNVLFNPYGWAGFAASNSGRLIYRAGEVKAKSQFLWFDRTGKPRGPAGLPDVYISDFSLSPDGRQIAMKWRDPATSSYDIWVMDWTRNFRSRFTEDPHVEERPVWSPDGRIIAFTSYRNGSADLFEKKVGGVSGETAMLDSPENEWPQAWSKDGRYLAYVQQAGLKWSIFILPLFGERKPFPIAQSSGTQWLPTFSFDGKWLAYSSNETGTMQVYVISFPAADQKQTISNNGGVIPQWRQDGRELYYLSLDGKLMAVDIAAGNGIDSGVPRVLFDTKLSVKLDSSRQYAATPDGQRFLLLKPLAEAEHTPFTVVLNWISLLKK